VLRSRERAAGDGFRHPINGLKERKKEKGEVKREKGKGRREKGTNSHRE
jgi:hypothetical protein